MAIESGRSRTPDAHTSHAGTTRESLGAGREPKGITGIFQRADADQEGKGPFVVRGHHIRTVQAFRDKNTTSEEFSATVAKHNRRLVVIPGLGTYARDISGYSPEDKEHYRAGMQEFLDTYSSLEPDDQVKIVADGQKDGICHSCVIGEHCNSEIQANADVANVTVFSKKAHELGRGDDISMVADADGTPKELITSAETFNQVILSMALRSIKDLIEHIRAEKQAARAKKKKS